ncbi:MAG: Lacal_2735 family protein [Bacteroidota bacterium]
MGLFGKKSEKQKLQKKYEKLMAEAHKLSRSDRRAADQKTAEADAVAKQMEALVD